MASQHQDDTVFDHDLDDDDDESSQSQDDDDDNDDIIIEENDDLLPDAEDDDDEEDEELLEHRLNPVPIAVPSTSLVTIASVPNGLSDAPPLSSSSPPHIKRARVGSTLVSPPPPPPPPPQEQHLQLQLQLQKKPQPIPMDESRRLFQRLWTDEDEIELLQGFLDYTAQRGSNHHDTALFYGQIKSKLQLDFNKNQLVEKLRRLKKKYRNVLNKLSSGKDFSFKSPHDQATFEISRKIWSSTGKICVDDSNLPDDDDRHSNPNPNHFINSNPNFVIHNNSDTADVKIEDLNVIHTNSKSTPRSRKRSRSRSNNVAGSAVKFEDKRDDGNVNNNNNNNNNNNGVSSSSNVHVSSLIEETVKSCLSPLFKELLSNAMSSGSCTGRGIGGLAMNALPLNFSGGEMMVDEKWRKQQILELEVYSKRLELVQDQIRAQLEELRSLGG